MDLSAFDTKKIDEYARQAKESWGQTKEYKEFEEKSKDWTKDDQAKITQEFTQIFVDFGKLLDRKPEDAAVQEQVKALQTYITEHFYTCSPEILRSLADMYDGGGSMTENIDKMGGVGTADFVAEAVRIYCK